MEKEGYHFRLLESWLGCNDADGNKFWFEEKYLFEYVERGKRKLQRLGKEIYWDYDMHLVEPEILGWLYDTVIPRLKPAENSGEPAKSFPNLRAFRSYMEVSLKGIGDLVQDVFGISTAYRFVSIEEKEEGGREIPDTEVGRTRNPQCALEEEEEEESAQGSDEALERLLEGFSGHLGKQRPALKTHLERLRAAFEERQRNEGEIEGTGIAAYDLVIFLQERGAHYPDITAYCEARGVNPNTCSSSNRRLRQVWRSYLEEEGKEAWERFKETIR